MTVSLWGDGRLFQPQGRLIKFRRQPEQRRFPFQGACSSSLAASDRIPPSGIEDIRLIVVHEEAGEACGLQQVLGRLGPLAQRALWGFPATFVQVP